MDLFGISLGAVLVASFIACSVEVTEIVIIVTGVGATRGWRSTIVGALSGLVVLAVIVGGLGQALTLIPIDPLRVVIGGLLLTFGLQWVRKGVIGVAADGFRGGEPEEEGAADDGPGNDGLLDWTSWLLAFKGVVLEGLEIAFIVLAFGAGSRGSATGGSYGQAYAGAVAAFVIIGGIGLVARGSLEKLPGRVLKFGIGGLLSTFGTFWALEGLGVHWPGERLSIVVLYGVYLATTFALAQAASMGWLGPRPQPTALGDPGPSGPLGVAPADARSIAGYQRDRGLEPSGVLDAATQAAMRAERAERGADTPDPLVVGVNVTDPEAVGEFQRRNRLPVTREVDAATRGALRVAQHPGLVHPADPDAVRRFQHQHGLPPTGTVDDATRVVMRAVRTEAARSDDGAGDGDKPARVDPVDAYLGLDPTDEASVSRLQHSLHLAEDGTIGPETRGALRALAARLADGAEDAREPSWVVGAGTAEPDPADADAVRDLQRRYGLSPDAVIGPRTRRALRWEHEHLLGVDPSSPASVRAFQARHGLVADGVVGPRTQAAMRAVRDARQDPGSGPDPEERYGEARGHAAGFGVGLDPADPESVRAFQRSHGLEADGVIGPRTQVALRGLRREHAPTKEEARR